MKQQSNAVILARVSSKSQEDEGYSLDSQLKLLGGYCENKSLRVARVFKITETASKEQSRKIFHEVLAYMLESNVYHLIVEKTDRLTRNLRDAVVIDDWLEQDKERMVHAVKENLLIHKEAKSDVKFMWNIHLAVAKKYTDNLREEAMKGWAEKLAQGWLPASPPIGYVTVLKDGKRIHVPDKKTMGLVKRAFKLYLDPNHSIASIADEMKKMGLTSRKGRPFAPSYVQKVLTNPFYIGINRFNGQDYPGAQEHLITKALFDAVQQKMHKGRPVLYLKHNPVLKNMIRCEDCQGVVTWEKHKGRYYGSCQRRKEICRGKKFLREDRAEDIITTMLEKLVCPSERIIEWVTASLQSNHQTDTTNREEIVTALRSKIDRTERMDNDLYDDKLAGVISMDKYTEKHEQFMSQKRELNEQLEGLDDSRELQFEHGLTILELSQQAARIYAQKSSEQKRVIMTELFHSMTVKDGSISVTFTKLAQAIAEKSEESRDIMQGPKSGDRTTKNDPSNRYDEGHLESENGLHSIWLGWEDSNYQ